MTIDQLKAGELARVLSVKGEGSLRQHLLDMGLIPGAVIRFVKKAPLGDPVEISVNGYSLTLRRNEAAQIETEAVEDGAGSVENDAIDIDFGYNVTLHEHNAHPGFGERSYHRDNDVEPLPKGTLLTFALAGQQNCGKTTLFNRLTGSNQHVGNFPGVTVDRKDGAIKGHPDTLVTDLPGIYSLSAYSAEELISRHFILEQKPSAIINIVDAGNIERHLYLTVQLMELGVPMILAINMMDELRASGGSIRINEMERLLGMPVLAISASKGEGIEELVEHAVHTARYAERPMRHDFCPPEEHGGALHRCLHGIMHLIEDHCERSGLPLRYAASRVVDGDSEVLAALNLTGDEKDMLESIVSQMEKERGLDRHAAMAEMRFSFIRRLCSRTVRRPVESKDLATTRRIDRVLTGRWTAIPAFIAIIGLVFYLTFDVLGAWLQDILDTGISWLGGVTDRAFESWEVSGPLRSLVVDAIFGGVGSVLSFVPIVVVLFFFLSLLEDSGYMARIAFVSDRLLRRTGLSGRSIVPMLIGFGCTVPGVMATRTLPSSRDRRLTILLLPFMSCSAKIAIYGFLAEAFFPGKAGLVMTGLYLLGIMVGLLLAVAHKLARPGVEAAPFVMELPVYRRPIARNVGHLLWDKTKDFIQRAFSVIFIATMVIWFLQSFDFGLNFVQGGSSMLAVIAGLAAPLMAPLGLGDWRIVTALISGFLAKESVVSTMEVLGAMSLLNGANVVPMLVFCLLYTPCVAAIASIKRELGRAWALAIALGQFLIAWICAWAAYMTVL